MKLKCWRLILLLIFSLLISGQFLRGQTKITLLEKDSHPLVSTDEVKCIRFADFSRNPVEIDMELEVGDVLESNSDSIRLVIEQFGAAKMIFSGHFRVVITSLKSEHFAINLLLGRVDIQSDSLSSVQSGEVLLGSESTQYALSVRKAGNEIKQEIFVHEGRIKVNLPELETHLSFGENLVKSPAKKTIIKKISFQDISHTSNLYSRIDVAKAINVGLKSSDAIDVYARLKELYQQVNTTPQDPKSRLALANEQIVLKIPSGAIYNLNQAEKYLPVSDSSKRAQIYLTKGVVYSKIGQKEIAQKQFQKAKLLDPNVLQKVNKQKLRMDSNVKRQFKITPTPSQRTPYSQKDLFNLLKGGQIEKAIKEFKKRLEGLNANSKDYYGLAISYKQMGDNKRASSFAREALKLTNTDRKLSMVEIEDCKRIAAFK
jgi:tetratricopeptide (TPR) repeat protein